MGMGGREPLEEGTRMATYTLIDGLGDMVTDGVGSLEEARRLAREWIAERRPSERTACVSVCEGEEEVEVIERA